MAIFKTAIMKQILIIMIILLAAENLFSAGGKVSAGITAGYQYDAGNLSEREGIDADLEHNVSLGGVFKFDMGFLFFRSGCEYSHPFEKGGITDGSAGDITETSISFYEVPVYGGINLPVRGYGFFYLGGGGSYIFGTGYVKTGNKDRISEQLFGWGFLAGIESEIYSGASIIFEWEYMAAQSSPVASMSGGYEDYCIDYSGSRFRFGVIYHFNRYQ